MAKYPMPRCKAVVTLGQPPNTVELTCCYAENHSLDHGAEFPGAGRLYAFHWSDGCSTFNWVRVDMVERIKAVLKEEVAA